MTSENTPGESTKRNLGASDEGRLVHKKYWLRWTLIYFMIAMLHGVLGSYLGIVHNPSGESCKYVKEDAPYHLLIEGKPCVLTSAVLVDIGLAFLFWAFVFLTISGIMYGFRWLRNRLGGA